MVERRKYPRVEYRTNCVLIDVKKGKKYLAQSVNISPLGMGVKAPVGTPYLVGEVVIAIADTLIMYAKVVRQERHSDGTFDIGLSAKRFTDKAAEDLYRFTRNEE